MLLRVVNSSMLPFAPLVIKAVMADDKKTERVQAMMTPEEVAAIDAFRRTEADLPTRSEAVRRLVQIALSTKK